MDENTNVVTQELTNTATEAVVEVAKDKTFISEVGKFAVYGAAVTAGSVVVVAAVDGVKKLAKWAKGKINDRRARKKAEKETKEQQKESK